MFWAFARNPLHAEEQTPVLFLGELLSIGIYDVHDFFLSQSISPYSAASPSDSRTLTAAVKNNDIPSVAVEYMSNTTCRNTMTDKAPLPTCFSATQVL